MDSHQQDLVAQFSAVTDTNPSVAQTALAAANWNLQEAVALHFAAHEDDGIAEGDDADWDTDEPQPAAAPSQPTPAPAQPAAPTSSRPGKAPARRGNPKHMTLDDLKKQQEGGGDDDDEEDDKKPRDLFAGGEKSGLAVQDPSQGGGKPNHFENILKKAQENAERPDAENPQPEQPQRSNFTGRAQTLGGEDGVSRVVEDPTQNDPQAQVPGRITRTMHLWQDGVSIDDGPLFRFDDPANARLMADINQGRAPLALLNVQPDQEVDLNLDRHDGENYKKKWKPFEGQGNRLGSPVPVASAPAPSSTTSQQPAGSNSSTATNSAPSVNIDDSQPTLQLQIRLGDGTRLPARFNTTHTIGDVYTFVDRAMSGQQRPYALMTTFPSQELSDRSKVLGEMSDFKRGGVVVQKWK